MTSSLFVYRNRAEKEKKPGARFNRSALIGHFTLKPLPTLSTYWVVQWEQRMLESSTKACIRRVLERPTHAWFERGFTAEAQMPSFFLFQRFSLVHIVLWGVWDCPET